MALPICNMYKGWVTTGVVCGGVGGVSESLRETLNGDDFDTPLDSAVTAMAFTGGFFGSLAGGLMFAVPVFPIVGIWSYFRKNNNQ